MKDKLVILEEIKEQRDLLMVNLKKYQEARDKLHADIAALKWEYEGLRQKDKEHFDKLLKERIEIETVLRTRETHITELTLIIKKLEAQRHELESAIDSLNDKLEALKDVKAQLTGAQSVIIEITKEKDSIRDQLNSAGDFMIDLESKVHKANNTSLELLR